MPIIDDYLLFTNSFAASDQWSLDPYSDDDDEDNIFVPRKRQDADDDDDDE